MLFNNKKRYGLVAKLLHWSMAVAIIAMIVIGIRMTDMELSPDMLELYGIHKSLGVTLFFLVILRLVWRFINVQPPLPAGTTKRDKFLAEFSHFSLYGFMLLMPICGVLMSMYKGFPVAVWDWFTLPNLVEANKEMGDFFQAMHYYAGYAFVALILAHFAASMYHHFYKKDDILVRMIK